MSVKILVNSNDVIKDVVNALGYELEDGVKKVVVNLELDKPVNLEITKVLEIAKVIEKVE